MLIKLLVIIKHYLKYLFLHVFYIFPVKKGQFYFDSFYGKSFSCNPKYIFLHLLKNKIVDVDKCYWTKKAEIKELDNRINQNNYCIPWNIRTIKTIMTSEFIIVNTDIPYYIPLRKKQCYIDTWHGGGAYKRCGFDNPAENTILNRFWAWLRSKQMNYLISSSKKFGEVMVTGLRLNENVNHLNIGMPRNDILFNKSFNTISLREELGIGASELVVLYAPTYRSINNNIIVEELLHNLNSISEAFTGRFGKKVKFIFRAHYYFASIEKNESIIDVTTYPDMQELLLISDVLITDYSSSIWDYSILRKPCFLFCPDYNEYNKERSFYTPIETWPGCFSSTAFELQESIKDFDYNKFEEKIDTHINKMYSYENGNACKKIEELIINKRS